MHDAFGRVLRHRQDPEHRDPGRQEPVECGVDHVADRTVRVAHDRLHVADGAEKVTAVDREGPAEPDDEVLGEVGHPDHLVRDDLTDRHDQVPGGEEELIDLDRDRGRHPPGRHRRDLVGADLAEPHESFAPPVLANASERDPVPEEQVRLVGCQRRMGAERGEDGDLAAGGAEPFEQQAGDLAGPRMQPGQVGRNEQHSPCAGGEHVSCRDLVHDQAQLVARDRRCGAADAPERCRRGADGKCFQCRFDAIDDRRRLTARIDRDDVDLVGRRRFECRELAVDHRRRHEVAPARGETPDDLVAFHGEIDEADVAGTTECVPVVALQRRAGDHGVVLGAHRLAKRREPRPAVVVGKRRARGHLLAAGGTMERVRVDERDATPRGQLGGDGRLSRPGDAHDDDPVGHDQSIQSAGSAK